MQRELQLRLCLQDGARPAVMGAAVGSVLVAESDLLDDDVGRKQLLQVVYVRGENGDLASL